MMQHDILRLEARTAGCMDFHAVCATLACAREPLHVPAPKSGREFWTPGAMGTSFVWVDSCVES